MTGAAHEGQTEQIAVNLANVQARIAKSAEIAGRLPADVRLIAVSKAQPEERIADAIATGKMECGACGKAP